MPAPRHLAGLCAGLLFCSLASAEALPQRWVSAGGAVSEWVVALGGEPRLVGVDTTSQHPESLKRLPSVGYQRQLAAEGLLSLRPELLVGTEEMGPPPVLAQVKAAGVQVEQLSSQPDLAALAHTLERLGALLGDPARAEQARIDYVARLDSLATHVREAQGKQAAPRVLLLVGHAGSNPLAAGKGTSGAWMIERAGGLNVADHSGYKALSNEALAALDPEVVVVADRALVGEAAREALLRQNPTLALTRAGRAGRFLVLDPTLLVGGLGPRLPDALAALSAGFYPQAPAPDAEHRATP
ncbi:heme/hemin ABC transporter substrate-binding protein [Metapseudomonas otitidis]|uniref:Heme-transporter PhuT n=1 Tax=Metapseudomonas otitidis TaxID=319939 RepID=A0A679GTQ8_9GAMM|nr:ABC transporter substrate-binding protein [Pseudomonas otitidis]BCA30849.1 heme-transporter PhuT [Pseudomonas otitidis]